MSKPAQLNLSVMLTARTLSAQAPASGAACTGPIGFAFTTPLAFGLALLRI